MQSESYMTDSEKEIYTVNLEHAKAGYANAQEIVKFVDSKTGILTGIVTATTAIPFALLNLLISSDSDNQFVQWFHNCGTVPKVIIMGSLGIAIWVGCLSLLNSTSGLMSRKPTNGHKDERLLWELVKFVIVKTRRLFADKDRRESPRQSKLTSLFPLFPQTREAEATENFRALESGQYSRELVLEEYGSQLKSMGIILNTKIERNQDAVRWFEIQVLFYAVCAIAALFTFLLSTPTADSDALERLERLGRLKFSGILTDGEFVAEKAKLLGHGMVSSTAPVATTLLPAGVQKSPTPIPSLSLVTPPPKDAPTPPVNP